jgi:hypothetical protein
VCQEPSTIRLTGLDSAPRQSFTVGTRAYLYAAARVTTLSGPVEPWFVVLDQDALVPSTASPAVVQAGRLFTTTPSVYPEALDVTVVGYPNASGTQSAWFTTRIDDMTDSVQAVLVATPSAPSWSVQRVVTRPLGAAGPAPTGLTIGAGLTGSIAILPEGPTGALIDVEPVPPAQLCTLGGVERAVDVTGPAGGAYRAYALDETGFLRTFTEQDIAAPTTCSATTVSVGTGPTAVEAFGQDFALRAFVPSTGSDTVTAVRSIDGTPVTTSIPLPAGSDPVDAAARKREESSCSIGTVTTSGGVVSWNGTNCPASGITYFVWCRCLEANPANCPLTCPAAPVRCPGCRAVGAEPWEPMGVQQGATSFNGDAGTSSVQYTVTTNGREPTK